MPSNDVPAATPSDPGHRSNAPTRRQVLKRAGVVGAHVAWAVPAIQLATAVPAMAASGPATITGRVTNAATGVAIVGATVISGAGQTAITNATGFYTLTGVPSGARTITASAPGYILASQPVTAVGGTTTTLNFALSQSAQAIRVAVTWGTTPADLDLHVSGPLSGGAAGRFHCYYRQTAITNASGDPYCQLDIDDGDGGGPETQSITISNSEGDFVAGTYRVWVHNYTNRNGAGASFSGSGATVNLFDLATQRGTFAQTAATGAATLPIWQVMEFDVNDAGVITAIRSIQTMNAGTETTVF